MRGGSSPPLADPQDHWWNLVLFLYIQPLIAIIGLVSNSLVLAVLPRSGVQVAPLARTFYIACAIGDLLIMFKIAAVFLTQISCFLRISAVCRFFVSATIFWKLVMPVWLVGELISGYSILLLNVERVLFTYFPHSARAFLVVRWNVLALTAIVCPIAVYVLAFGFHLYIIERKAEIFPGFLIDTDKRDPHSVHFGIATKLLCFLLPVAGTAALTVAVLVKLVHHARHTRSRATTNRSHCMSSVDDSVVAAASAAATEGVQSVHRAGHNGGLSCSRSIVMPSLIAVVISTLNVCLYLPTLIFWIIYEFVDQTNSNNCGDSPSIVATILPLGVFFFSLTGIAHTTNFFIYLKFMYSIIFVFIIYYLLCLQKLKVRAINRLLNIE